MLVKNNFYEIIKQISLTGDQAMLLIPGEAFCILNNNRNSSDIAKKVWLNLKFCVMVYS